jgi:signal transduction histidine kinase
MGLALVGVLAAVVAAGITVRSRVLLHPTVDGVARLVWVASYTAVGVRTYRRRPDSRLGMLIAGVGLLYAIASLMALPGELAFTIGRLAIAVLVVFMSYVLLCFPRDRLSARGERRFMEAFALSFALLWVFLLAVAYRLPTGGPFTDCSGRCPANPLRIVGVPSGVGDVLAKVTSAIAAIGLAWVAVLLVRHARSPSRQQGRATAPVMWVMIPFVFAYALWGVVHDWRGDMATVLAAVVFVSGLSFAPAMLAGQVRGRVFAAASLGKLVATAGTQPNTPEFVQGLLARALGDPSLTLALWDEQRAAYIDSAGAPVNLSAGGSGRMNTPITRDGAPYAVLSHDPGLDGDPEIIEGIAATGLLVLENARLADRLSEAADEVRASRSRIAAAAHRERLRLERDLHDGAQQRLMVIQIKLGLVRDTHDERARNDLLDELAADAADAVEELRTLARGIYPPVLHERGLADALRSVAAASPVPVRLTDAGIGRYPAPCEAAVYFSCLEAVHNATKHGGPPARVTITLEPIQRGVAFTVSDDGVGFDAAARSDGVGLLSMRDRLRAIGGELEVSSVPGQGSTIRGIAPAQAHAEPDAGSV